MWIFSCCFLKVKGLYSKTLFSAVCLHFCGVPVGRAESLYYRMNTKHTWKSGTVRCPARRIEGFAIIVFEHIELLLWNHLFPVFCNNTFIWESLFKTRSAMRATGPLLENALALSINQRLHSEYLFVVFLCMHLWTFLLYFIVTWTCYFGGVWCSLVGILCVVLVFRFFFW